MLTLQTSKRKQPSDGLSHTRPPTYIFLEGSTTIGRGYDNDVQLLLPWLSRRHIRISLVDDAHFLEAVGKTGVFVNQSRVDCMVLKDGDIVTVTTKQLASCMRLPKHAGPLLSYDYRRARRSVPDPENAYVRQINPSDLMSVSEEVNGRVMDTTYHTEDFNCTPQQSPQQSPLQSPQNSEHEFDASQETTITAYRRRQRRKSALKKRDVDAAESRLPCSRTHRMRLLDDESDTATMGSDDETVAVRVATLGPSSETIASVTAAAARIGSVAGTVAARTATIGPSSETMEGVAAAIGSIAESVAAMTEPAGPSGETVAAVSATIDSSAKTVKGIAATSGEGLAPKAVAKMAAASAVWTKTVAGIADVSAAGPRAKNVTATATVGSKTVAGVAATATVGSTTKNVPGVAATAAVGSSAKNVAGVAATTAVGSSSKTVAGAAATVGSCVKNVAKVTATVGSKDIVELSDPVESRACSRPNDDAVPGPSGITKKLDNNISSEKASRVSQVGEPRLRKRAKVKHVYTNSDDDDGEVDDGPAETDYIPPNSTKRKRSLDSESKLPSKKVRSVKSCTSIQRVDTMCVDRWKTPSRSIPKPRLVTAISGLHLKHLVLFTDKDVFKVEFPASAPDQHNFSVVEVNVTVDMSLLEHKLRCNSLNPEDTVSLFQTVRRAALKIDMNEFLEPHAPRDDVVPAVQPPGMTLTLKQYQLKTVGWMVQLEKDVGTAYLASRLVKWQGVKCDLMFDLGKHRVYFPPVPPAATTCLKVHAKGGILADEMGLGKTITMLGLIVSHSARDFPRIPERDGFDSQNTYRLPCWTTLIIAPSHLTAQWKHEAQTHAPSLRVHLITTKPEYHKLSYVDILQADIIVVSVQFLLKNKAYTTMPTGTDAETSFINLLRKPGTNLLLEKAPNLCHFEWWRVVCDEGHELLTYDTKYKRGGLTEEHQPSAGLTALEKLSARHRWYVTGTPFPNQHRSLQATLKFLEFTVDDPTMVNADSSLKVGPWSVGGTGAEVNIWPVWNLVRKNFYVRHTKESISEEYDVPEYVEELLLLTMSDVERGIYDRSVSELERRQLCCHLQIATRLQHVVGVQQKSLDEVRIALIDHTQKEMRLTIKRREQCQEDIKKAKITLAEEEKAHLRTMHRNRIKRLGEDLVEYGTTMKKHEGALTYFESIIPRITHSADEPCVICFDKIESLTVTPCGHLFCRKCILPCITQNASCPTCRNHVRESELIVVKDGSMRDQMNKNAEVRKLTEQYGTKMAYLIFYLKQLMRDDPNSRVIIFSQWDSMLHMIGDTLHTSGLRNVFVKGNVYVRNKAIMSFRKQENVRVIMLSLENAASGTNLVEATHVILIDPVADTKQRAVAIEGQAIGRAHRMGQHKQISVVRMIIKDTIEHQLYTRNNDQDVRQVEFNFDDENVFGGAQIVRTVRAIPKPIEISRPLPDPAPHVASTSRRVNNFRNYHCRMRFAESDIEVYSHDEDDYYDDDDLEDEVCSIA